MYATTYMGSERVKGLMTNLSNNAKTQCPVCVSKDIEVFVEIRQVPVHCNLLWQTRDEAVQAARGDIRLGFCKDCGHIFNLAFDPDLTTYNQEYENSQHFSLRFQKYARLQVERLIEDYGLYNKDIIEIGCGKGNFLILLCELGGNRGVGFDPSFEEDRFNRSVTEGITFIRDFYSEQYSNYKADFICSQHVLEHLISPRDFLINLRNAIGNRMTTAVFLEVPDVFYTLRDLGIWDLIYEHYSYFSISSLAHLFTVCGFQVLDIAESFEGQCLCVDALPVTGQAYHNGNYRNYIKETSHYVSEFGKRYRNKVNVWKRELKELSHEKKRVVVWGVGSKGVTFLNTLKIQDKNKYVVDINPYKQGKYVPGTGQMIMPPESLRKIQPDIIIVMNPAYTDEVQHIIKSMNVTAQVITA